MRPGACGRPPSRAAAASERGPPNPPPFLHTPSTEHGPYCRGAAHHHRKRGPSISSAKWERESTYQKERASVDLRERGEGESATRLREREEECGCRGRRSETTNPKFLYLYRRWLSGLDWAC